MIMAEQKKRTSEGLYSALQQISDEEGVDFGLSGMSADDFKKKYFTGPGNIENLYHRLDKISREEGIDFGQGSRDEWLSSFGYKRNPNGGRGYMTLDGRVVGGGKPKALKPHSQQRPAGGGAFGLPEGTTYSDEVVRRHNSPSNVAGDYKDWSKIASEVESEGLPAYRHGTKEPVRRDASSYGAPYKPDTQLTAAQRDEIHRQNDFAVRQMRQLEKRTREEQQRRSRPIVDTGDEGVNRHVIKTQGQWEDELQGGVSELGKKFVTPLVSKAMKQAEDAWYESMRESSSAPMGDGMELHALRRANEAADPDKILQGLQQSLEQAYNTPQMQADIEKRANAAGIPKEDYISNVVVPSLREQLEGEFASSQIAKNMPRNAVEYVLQGLGNSVGGMLMSAATETRSQRAYKNQAAAMTEEGQNPYYQPGTGARLTQMGVTFAADAPFFGLYGKVGGSVAKHVAEREIKKLMAKGLSEGAARSVVGTALENSVGARMKNYLMQHVISSSITMGGFNMTSEAARQVRDSEFAPGQILTSGLEGAATGAAFGVTGGAVQAVSQPLRGIARIGSKAGGFLAEAETMYATEELAKMVHGEEGFSNPFEGSIEALMKLGVMKASSGHPLMKAVETGASIRKNGLGKTISNALSPKQSGMRFTEDEEAYVRNSTEGKNLLDALSRMHPEVAVSEADGKNKLTPEGEQLRQQLARNYSDFMGNQDIPYSVKMKVARALGGLMPDAAHTPLETGADIIHNADGSVILKTRDRDDNCMQDLKFDTFSDAEAWREAHEGQFRLNDAVNMWNESGAETRSKMLRELMEEYSVDVRQAREMIDATLDGALGTSFDNEQFLSIYDTIHRNAYPADEAHTRRNYWEGMKLTPGERHQAMMEAQRAEERLEYMDGEFADEVKGAADYADEKIAELAGRDEITGEQLEAAIDYYNKVAKANGMMEEALNSVDSQVEAANAFIRRNTHTGSGQLIECAKGERGYYVTAGNLKLNPDGSIDMESSGDVVILRDKSTGEIEVVNPRDVKVTAISDPRRMMAENDSMDGLRGRLMKEADDSISLAADTPKEPQNGDMFLGEDGMRWMTMQADDGTGNPVWVKMALDEQMQPVGEPLPLDVDEYRRAKSIEIDEQSMPREEHTTADAATEEMPAEETPAEAAEPEKSRVTGAGGGETPITGQPHSEVDVLDEIGRGNQDAPLPPVGQAVGRIPVDQKGRPQFEQAAPEDTMAELTEKYGEEKAGRMVATMAANTQRALEELQQKDTSKMTDMADLAAHEDALADAERKAAYWQQFMKKEEPKAEEPTTEQPRIEETKVDEPAIEQPEQHQEPQTPVQPQQPQPPAQPAPPQPQQPTGQEKIYRGSTEANVGRTFTFTNSAGVRSELTIERVDGEGNAVVSRRDFDQQGNPTGEAREESYAAARVGEAIVDGTWKQVKSVEDRLREAYKGRLGMQNVIDVLTEAEKERMLDATERGDDEALREMQNEFVETHRGDIILKTRDKRNQSVSGILSGGFSIGEKLRRIRKQFQGYDDAEIMLSDEALQPSTLEEYVADLHSSVPKKGEGPIAYFSYGEGNARVIGMQDETGHGTKTGGDTKGYAPWLAPKGKGMSLQKYAETIHEQLPEGIKEQYSDQDVRNAILEVFGGAERPSDIPTMIIRRGVLQAEQAARRMEEMWIDGVSYQKKPKSFAERLQRGIEQTSQEPSEAQKEAGNYAKGHVTFGGYHFTIENPAGSVRRGTDADGHQWEQQMHHTYGYILGRYGKDGDHLDMFINDKADLDEWNGRVYVVDQIDPKTGRFDEHKILYGFDSLEEARRAYLSNYEEGWQGLGRITGVSKEKFDEWVDSSKRKMKPFAEHSIGRESAVEDVRERQLQEQQRQQEAAAREQVLLDAAIEHLQKHGMEVITDEEGQRVIDRFNGRLTDDVKQMGTTTKKRQESLTASFEGRELSTEQQVVVDAFTGRISNGVLTVKDRKGKTRNITLKQGEDRKAGVKHSLFRHYGTNENFYNADEILFIPDVIANGVRSQAKSKVAYKLEKDGVTYTVTTLLKSNGKEIFTNFYTDREPIAGINGKSNTAMQHLPQQSDSGAKVQQNPDTTNESEEKISFHKVEAGETLDALNNGPTVKRYRAMQLIDGKLYPPMSAKVGKEMREPTEIGVWEQSEERPDLIDSKTGKFKLDKGQKGQGSVPAAYNPYFHTSTSGLNDQFTSAYKRPELVVVEVEIPESELTSGYKAQYAKDAVGDTDWHSGPVNGSLPEDRKRTVTLSRYVKVKRIVPDSEVADMIAAQLEGTNAEVPYNVVTPALRKELEARGVKISAKASGTVTEDINGNPIPKGAKLFKTPDGEAYGFTYQGRMYIDKRIANVETPVHEYGHLWVTMKRTSAPEEWSEMKGVLLGDKLVKPILDKVRDEYPELTTEGKEDDFMEEVLTQFSGRRGAERLREVAEQVARENGGIFGKAEAVTAMQRLKNVLNRFWESVARMLGVKYRNANDIADMMMKDFLNGVDPREGGKPVGKAGGRKDMRVYHGSSAEFEQFDHSKVGSGEGQAVSGYGTYVTTSEGTARYYAEVSSERHKNVIQNEGWTLNGEIVRDSSLKRAYDFLKEYSGNVDEAMAACEAKIEARKQMKDAFSKLFNNTAYLDRALDYLRQEKEKPGTLGYQERIEEKPDRQLYEVEIPDDTGSNYLDLDAKLTKKQKAEIKKRFFDAINHGEEAAYWRRNRDIINDEWRAVDSEEGTGDMARGVMEQFIPQSDVSKIFSDMGYVGSKTRGSDGTTYIVYNEKDLKIKDRMMFQKKSASEPFRLSAEQKDAEGSSFYERKGSVDLWNISPLFTKARRQDAPIRLTERNANHIMSSHGNVFKSEQDVFDFLDGVFSNATKLRRGRGRGMFVVVENDKTDQAAIIKLMPSESGDYYNVETAGYYRKSKWKDSEVVIADLSEPGQSDAAADASKPQIPDENGREPINTEAQVPSSAGKDTKNIDTIQENGQENADEAPKFQRVGHPEAELTPEERQYWRQWEAAMKKWKERNGIGADETGPGEKPQFQPGEMALDFAKRLMRHKRQEALWRTAPKLKDYQQVRDDKDSQELAREQEAAYPDSQWARMQRVAADMARLRHSMKRQKEYDKATVKAVTDFAHDFMAMGFGEELGRNDVKRILSSVKNATGARDIRKHLDNVMNILTDNYLRNLKAQLDKLASVKDLRQTVQGVDRQGKLDIKGQKMIQEFRKAMGAELASGVDNITRSADEVEGKVKSLRDRLSVISENMEKGDAAMWEEEYEGVSLALQYFDNIARSQANVTSYREQREDAVKLYKQSGRSYEAQQQLLEAIDQAIFDESVERIGMYGDLLARLQGKVSESMEGAKAFREKKKERLKLIHTLAARDMEGIDADTTHEETWKSRLNNSSVPRLFLGSAASFEQMLRLIGGKNANGEGWTYSHMMRGYIGSVDNEQIGREEAYRELDAKVSELFGRKMRFSDLYAVDRDTKNFPPATVEWLTADGEKKKHTVSQAQLLNIYMWDKQVQGAVKLRAQGIDEAAVERIKKALDPRLLQLADWLQGDFLARRREKYSKVYERVFGAAMPAVENYFPLRVDGDAITRDIDVTADPASDNVLPSNVTGSIIRRTANSKPLDILNTDAISLVIEHIDNMEKWSAFVEWYEDINALLSYSRFRNQVKNMGNTLYGSGEKLWENFRKTAQIAAGTYRPSRSEADKAITTIASGVTGAKIAFRPFTALKQLLSAPAFMTDASAKYFTYSFVNQKNFWHDNVKWAKENMPVLRKRWTSRDLGDTRLTDKTGWGYWDTKVRGFMAQYGMWMNGGIDLLTCAAGARAIYRTRYDRYVRQGFDKDTAHKRALQDAEIGYNLTQQSSEGAFVSAIQKDRTLFANAYSVFRNSSMSYTRQTVTAIRNIRNLAASKKEMIETMERQLKADGLSEADAGKAARWEYKRAWWRNGVRLAVSAWVLPLFWELGSKVPYLFLGDDDDTKKKMLEDVLKKELVVGPVEGFVGGQTYNALWGAASSEDLPGIYREQGLRAVFKEGFKAMERQDASPLPLFADMGRTLHKFTYDETAGLQDMVNLAVQMVTGFNPQTLTDPIVAAIDWSRGDMDSAKEIEVFLLRVLMVPQESAKNVYIDELGMTADKAKALGYDELAERYARYMVQKGAPMTGWMYSDADEKKRMDSHVKRFSDDVTRRMEQLDQKEMLGIWNSSGSIEEKRLMGKVLAARAMSRDTDGEKPKYDWQRTYQEVRTLDDVDKGLLLFKLKQELGADKESNAKVLKAIEKKQKKMTETKKKLHDGKLTAEEAQKRIRKLRNEAIELAVKAGATGR